MQKILVSLTAGMEGISTSTHPFPAPSWIEMGDSWDMNFGEVWPVVPNEAYHNGIFIHAPPVFTP